jgi:drug/metabolite transporter (DMT)-like permease
MRTSYGTTFCSSISKESCGLLYLLLSAVLFSLMGAFLKIVTQEGIPSTQLVFFRAAFQGCFVVLGMFYYRVEEEEKEADTASTSPCTSTRTGASNCIATTAEIMTPQNDQQQQQQRRPCPKLLIKVPFGSSNYEKKIVILRGIVGGGFGFICYFYSIKSLPLGDAVTLFSIYPIYTIFMAKCILNEDITFTHVILTITNLIGGIMIAGPSFLSLRNLGRHNDHPENGNNNDYESNQQYHSLGYATALAGGFFAASVVVLIRKAGAMGIHTLQLLFSWCCFGLLSSILFGITIGKTVEGPWIWPPNLKSWLCILVTVILGTAAHFLLNYAGRFAPAGLCAIVRSTDILWAYILEVLVFKETPNTTTIVGVVMIVISLSMIALEKFREEETTRGISVDSRGYYDTVLSCDVERDDDISSLSLLGVEMKEVTPQLVRIIDK